MSLSGDFYYRILPTYKKQKVEYLSLFNEKNGTDFESVRDAEEFRLKKGSSTSIHIIKIEIVKQIKLINSEVETVIIELCICILKKALK